MSFMNESILDGFADLGAHASVHSLCTSSLTPPAAKNLHFHNAIIRTDIEHLPPKLMRQMCNGLQMLMLMPQRLTSRQATRMIIPPLHLVLLPLARLLGALGQIRRVRGGHFAMMRHQLLEVLRAQDGHLRQQQFALHERGRRVVEDGPDGDEVLELPPGLLDDAVLARQHDRHARQVLDFRVADDERVDVEAARGEDAGHAGEHAGLVLHEAVEDVSFRGCGGGERRFVEDRGDGGRGGPGGRDVGCGERGYASVQGFVGEGGGRGGGVLGAGWEILSVCFVQERRVY